MEDSENEKMEDSENEKIDLKKYIFDMNEGGAEYLKQGIDYILNVQELNEKMLEEFGDEIPPDTLDGDFLNEYCEAVVGPILDGISAQVESMDNMLSFSGELREFIEASEIAQAEPDALEAVRAIDNYKNMMKKYSRDIDTAKNFKRHPHRQRNRENGGQAESREGKESNNNENRHENDGRTRAQRTRRSFDGNQNKEIDADKCLNYFEKMKDKYKQNKFFNSDSEKPLIFNPVKEMFFEEQLANAYENVDKKRFNNRIKKMRSEIDGNKMRHRYKRRFKNHKLNSQGEKE